MKLKLISPPEIQFFSTEPQSGSCVGIGLGNNKGKYFIVPVHSGDSPIDGNDWTIAPTLKKLPKIKTSSDAPQEGHIVQVSSWSGLGKTNGKILLCGDLILVAQGLGKHPPIQWVDCLVYGTGKVLVIPTDNLPYILNIGVEVTRLEVDSSVIMEEFIPLQEWTRHWNNHGQGEPEVRETEIIV